MTDLPTLYHRATTLIITASAFLHICETLLRLLR
jgi:hypothetical protein